MLISSGLGTCFPWELVRKKFDMTCYTEAYFDLLFGVDAVAELPVPDDDASSDNGTLSLKPKHFNPWTGAE
jgi:hypothetical protein